MKKYGYSEFLEQCAKLGIGFADYYWGGVFSLQLFYLLPFYPFWRGWPNQGFSVDIFYWCLLAFGYHFGGLPKN